MTPRILALIATTTAVLACTPATTRGPDPQIAVDELTTTLDDALAAAKSYGMKHLGHYLELDGEALVEAGFSAPEGITLAVQPGHDGFCLAAEHTALPGDHAWRVGSIDSRHQRPTPGNTCTPGTAPAADLQTSVATAGGGLVCLLPPAGST